MVPNIAHNGKCITKLHVVLLTINANCENPRKSLAIFLCKGEAEVYVEDRVYVGLWDFVGARTQRWTLLDQQC